LVGQRGEYLYVDLGSNRDTFNTVFTTGGGGAVAGTVAGVRTDVSNNREHLFRFGLNYRDSGASNSPRLRKRRPEPGLSFAEGVSAREPYPDGQGRIYHHSPKSNLTLVWPDLWRKHWEIGGNSGGARMPIYRLLQNSPFGPEEISMLADAYNEAMKKLGLVDRNDPVAEIVAKKVIELGQRGIRESKQLSDLAVKELGVG